MKKSKGNNVTYQWLKSQDRVIAGLIPLPWLYRQRKISGLISIQALENLCIVLHEDLILIWQLRQF